LLQAADVEFVLLEARDRLGGRVLTVDDAGQPCDDGYDLGPSWFWPAMQPAIGALVVDLGLPSFEQNSEGDVVFERMSLERAGRYRGESQMPPSMRLVGGTASLIRAFARDLPAYRILTDARVTAMTLRDEGVALAIAQVGGGTEMINADYVIAAMPPRLLVSTVAFAPGLDEPTARRWRTTPTWMAPHAKFLALYNKPFWREMGLSGTAQSMVGPMAEMHDASKVSGEAALFGFFGVGAEERAALGEEKLTRACLDQLARLFGAAALTPRATLLKDWATDPLTATSADKVAGGHPAPAIGDWVGGAWHGRLALGGSEASRTDPGYLAGAVEAAARAVADARRELEGMAARQPANA
jgi:monoamine oxidase